MFKTDELLSNFKFERGRQLFLFLFCLFLAFVIWIVHNLSNDYSQLFEYKVYASVQLKGHDTGSASVNNLVIRGKANGFYILKHRFSSSDTYLNIKVNERFLKRSIDKRDEFYILTSDVKDVIVESVADRMSLEYFSVDTLFFEYPSTAGKEVPVSVKSSLTFKEQYMPEGVFHLTPSSVFISGDEDIIKEIDTIYTHIVAFDALDKNISGFVDMNVPDGISLHSEEAYYTLNVTRFVEERYHKSLSLLNVPDNQKIKVTPETLLLIFRYKNNDLMYDTLETIVPVVDFKMLGVASDTVVRPSFSRKIPSNLLFFKTVPQYVHVKVLNE